MDNANKIIEENLQKKLDSMNQLYTQIKKVIKKKDYLKDFNNLRSKKLNNYDLDSALNENLKIMLDFKDDYKALNNEEFNSNLQTINEIDQIIIANKKYYNKNNNLLVKSLKGYTKVVAKLNKIVVKTSYELKESKKD